MLGYCVNTLAGVPSLRQPQIAGRRRDTRPTGLGGGLEAIAGFGERQVCGNQVHNHARAACQILHKCPKLTFSDASCLGLRSKRYKTHQNEAWAFSPDACQNFDGGVAARKPRNPPPIPTAKPQWLVCIGPRASEASSAVDLGNHVSTLEPYLLLAALRGR